MRAFGQALAGELTRGDILCLTGDLGAGKTTLSQAIGAGLGVDEPITSPTFTLMNVYDSGRYLLYHFDVYRAASEEEMLEIGFDEYIDGDGVSIVEWADQVRGLIPEPALWIAISYGEAPGERILTLDGHPALEEKMKEWHRENTSA